MDEEYLQDEHRTAEEIARRALIVSSTTAVAYGDSPAEVSTWLRSQGLWADLSPGELAFMQASDPRKEDRILFSWGVERLVPLLWSIHKIASMPPLTHQCETGLVQQAVVWPPDSSLEFVRSAELRPSSEINKEYEKVYHAHWCVRDAQIHERPIPDDLNAGVVLERHYAFNWIIGYFGQGWDEITTDT